MKLNSISKLALCGALFSAAAFGVAAVDGHGAEHIKAAVAHKDRPAEDVSRDQFRKPVEVLEFIGVQPGMKVVDVNSGAGYYTEILSRAVGADGTVIAHNGPVYWSFVKNQIAARYDGRLGNVRKIYLGSENVAAAEGTVDVAMAVLSYHDYFFKHKERKGEENIPEILGSIHKALKDDGVFVVIDHVAPAGSGTEAGNSLHRIDPELVKEQVLAAGFKLAESSDILANPEDPHTISPFAEGIRGKTDRFIFKFVKK